jgi:parvulin-like peptidyl-prolyl isomerase
MIGNIKFSDAEIIEEVKLSCQLPDIGTKILTRRIIEKTVLELGIEISDDELQKAADQMRFLNNLTGVDATYKWLEKQGLSLEDFESIAQNTLYATKLAEHLFGSRIEAHFSEHQLSYGGAVLYEILFRDEDLAMETFYAIKEGEITFYEAARKYIQDIELNRKGGYLGVLSRKQLKAELSAAVFAANAPQLLKPITTSKGIHLIFVEEIVVPQLDDTIHYQILSELFDSWVQQQINNCYFGFD